MLSIIRRLSSRAKRSNVGNNEFPTGHGGSGFASRRTVEMSSRSALEGRVEFRDASRLSGSRRAIIALLVAF